MKKRFRSFVMFLKLYINLMFARWLYKHNHLDFLEEVFNEAYLKAAGGNFIDGRIKEMFYDLCKSDHKDFVFQVKEISTMAT